MQTLHDLSLSVAYDKIISIKDNIANAVKSRATENEGVYISSCISSNPVPYFAIDNVDVQIDTPDGKNQLHGTAIAVSQQKD